MQCSLLTYIRRCYTATNPGLSNAIRDKQITMVRMYKALGGTKRC